jgi:hypothetical protein
MSTKSQISAAPRFAHLVIPDGEFSPEKLQAIASSARTHIRTIGGGLHAIGELMFYACEGERTILDPYLSQRLGWFIRSMGEQADELIDMYAEAVSAGAKP